MHIGIQKIEYVIFSENCNKIKVIILNKFLENKNNCRLEKIKNRILKVLNYLIITKTTGSLQYSSFVHSVFNF